MTARTLPLFPLPVVLFPGVTLPLHIFEPRYRRMVSDCMTGDRTFALVRLPEGMAERELPSGSIGCVARIETVDMLPDGRSNLSVAGVERVALDHFVESAAPYHVASVTPYADAEPPRPEDETRADSLRDTFDRVIAAARVLTGEQRDLPPLPEDPTLLVFRIAAMIDIDLDTRQQLLESRSPRLRLETMQAVLDRALPPLERRAEIRTRAKRNGHAPLEP